MYEGTTRSPPAPAPRPRSAAWPPARRTAYTVAAYNASGESAKSGAVSATTTGCVNTGLPKHALIGYLHASFANGSGYLRMADVPAAWDIINLAFGEPTSVTSGDIRFRQCPVAECPGVESEAEFIAAIRAKQAQGKKVLISIGGANGQVQLTTTAARDTFVSSVSAIIDRYGLDGLDIDFEGHSLYLNAGDSDFRNPTTPVIVNLISALRTLKARYGSGFVLTMAPETFFVQLGLPVLRRHVRRLRQPGRLVPAGHLRPAQRPHRAARAGLQLGPDHGPGQPVPQHGRRGLPHRDDRHAAAGFPVANTGNTFPALREDQIAFGMPAAVSAGNGYTAPAVVQQARQLPGQGTRLRRLHPARRHRARLPRPDDLVDQLGPVLQLGVQEHPRALPQRPPVTPPHPRAPPGPRPGGAAFLCVDHELMDVFDGVSLALTS